MERKELSYKKNMAIVFIGFITAFFLLGSFLPERVYSESENRYLAKKPSFSWEKLLDGSFGSAYETYLSDQFPWRNALVAVKVGAERLLFKTDVNGVYFGSDHYYIEKFDSEELFTAQLTKNLEFLAKASEEFIEKLGAEHVKIMLAPSASQILTEKLPAFAAPADQSRVATRLGKMLSDPEILLPIEQALLAHKEQPVYYKTDHHWTTKGAYYGYRLYIEAMGATPMKEQDFLQKTVSEHFLGTIQSKVNISLKPDSIVLYLPKERQEYRVFYDGLSEEFNTLYNEKALEGKDQYSIFLDGNHGLSKICNDSRKNGKKLLLIKDSFAHSIAPFISLHFEEIHMVDLRYFNMPLSGYMEEEGITDLLVLYQIPGFAKDTNLFKITR